MSLIERRIGLLFAAFLLLLLVAVARASWLGTVEASGLREMAATQQVAEVPVPARRGAIVDRNQEPLAVSEAASAVAATPYLIANPNRVAKTLAPILRRPEGELLEKLTRRDTGFVYLARSLPGGSGRTVEKLKIEGIAVLPESRRIYPHGFLASQVLGVVGTDGNGLAGLEYSHDDRLRGEDGKRRLVKDALGEPIELRDTKPAKAGETLELTLDAAIQDRAERVLQGLAEKFKPAGATAIVMDPRTSELLAVANWPQIDANRPGAAPPYARQDRSTGITYEPGSTFKAFTVAGALEDRTVTPETPFGLAPSIQVADRVINESHERGAVTLTTTEILAQSSNVGAITIGQKIGRERFDYWVRRFGFGRKTGVDLPGEERGIVLPLDEYSGSTMGNLPIGQGIAVTTMQMASAYAAIANGGILRPPRVVRRANGKPVPTPRGKRVISARTARQIRVMLQGVLAPGGTASEVQIPGYDLAGKTGTANKVDQKTGEYSESSYVASFVGFAPARNPRLLVSVMVDEPKGEIFGGQVAAPAFKDILQFALPYLRIPPN